MPIVAIDARDAYGPQLRGWGRYVRDLVGALPEHPDLEYHVISQGGRGPELFFEQFELPVLLRRSRADLVHAPNCFLPLARPCMGVVTIHDLAFEVFPDDFSRRTGWKYRTFTRRAARSAQRVICVSGYTAADVVRRYDVDEARVRIIPNAPSLPIGEERVPDEGPYLLAVGDLRPKKNLMRLVHAFRQLRNDGLEHRLVLAGVDGGPEASRVREAAAGEPVRLTGYLSDARLDALMRGADALVHPSLYEGFGLVLVEAMARGVPVVAARATALPETGGDAAAYFDPLDVGDMAAAIGGVVGDRERHAELARRGVERARRLSWATSAALTVAVYEEMLT
ncbi:MAG TPA: glycosyltransferase family 1 protein [Solirubrobacteraceae bacterium]|nr:glycosyltransferase family 1 protein [Solirubrobacteraceae bacterium]